VARAWPRSLPGPLGISGRPAGLEHPGPLQAGAGEPVRSAEAFVGGRGGCEPRLGLVVTGKGGGKQAKVVRHRGRGHWDQRNGLSGVGTERGGEPFGVDGSAEVGGDGGPVGHGQEPVEIEGDWYRGLAVQGSQSLAVVPDFAGGHGQHGVVHREVDAAGLRFQQRNDFLVETSLREAEAPQLPGKEPVSFRLPAGVTQFPGFQEKALGLREPAGGDVPTGQGIDHPESQRRLAEPGRQPIRHLETAIGFLHLLRLEGRSAA
jgi:hypothetical protein